MNGICRPCGHNKVCKYTERAASLSGDGVVIGVIGCSYYSNQGAAPVIAPVDVNAPGYRIDLKEMAPAEAPQELPTLECSVCNALTNQTCNVCGIPICDGCVTIEGVTGRSLCEKCWDELPPSMLK
jgi:hypothetical protein